MSQPDPEETLQGRLALIARGLGSQQRAARAARVSLSQYKRYLTGDSRPTLEAMVALSLNADLDFTWLGLGRGESPAESWAHALGEAQRLRNQGRVADLRRRLAALAADGGGELPGHPVADPQSPALDERWLALALEAVLNLPPAVFAGGGPGRQAALSMAVARYLARLAERGGPDVPEPSLQDARQFLADMIPLLQG